MRRGLEQSERPSITAIVTTYNEEHNIKQCLDSLRWCDEILVVDSFSKDRTAEIARSYPNVVFKEHAYYGGAAQKNWAMRHGRHEWMLLFDADERCTPELRDEIEALLARGPQHNAYTIRRRLFFLGRPIRFCGWHNERVVRLFRRGTAGYQNRRVHARMITDGPAPRLRHPMDHYMVHDLAEYASRMTRYGTWGAAQGWLDRRPSTMFQVIGRPLWRFFRTWILQAGILDGRNGLMFCLMQAWGTFVKWSVLWSWRVSAKRGERPQLPEFDTNPETWDVVPGASGRGDTRSA